MKLNRDMLLLYAVTDRRWTGQQTLYEQIEAALQGGVTMVQLREKTLDTENFVKEAFSVRGLCHQYGVPLIINDRVDVALRCRADGVHVGAEDASVASIRTQAGPDFIIGATAKTIAQAQAAEEAGADYLGVGAVFPSPTKTAAIRISQDELREIAGSVHIPAVAIGGIDLTNACELHGCGISGIAVVSAIFGADDIFTATRLLKEKAAFIAAGGDRI